MPTRPVVLAEHTGTGFVQYSAERDLVLQQAFFSGGDGVVSFSSADDGSELATQSVLDRFYLKNLGWPFLSMSVPVPKGKPIFLVNFSAATLFVQLIFDEVVS